MNNQKSEYLGISSRDAFGKQLIALAKENAKSWH